MNIQEKHKWYNIKWFKRMAPFYDYVEVLVMGLREKVAQKIKRPDAKILDMACGTGNQSIAFAKKGFSTIGIDLSPDMLKYAKKKIKPEYDIKFINEDAVKINYTDSTFDVSSISFGLHDMPESIGIKVLEEIIRTTKKDGQIIIVDYFTPMKKISTCVGHLIVKIWEGKHYDYFRKVGLNHYLSKVNLKAISKEPYLLNNIQIVECINKKV